MAQGNKGINTEQLVKLMTIAIVATLVMVAGAGILFVIKTFSDNGDSDSHSTDPTVFSTSSTTAAADSTVKKTADPDLTHEFAMPADASADDSAKIVESYTPDDPYYSPAKFNVTSAEYGQSLNYYKLLFDEELTLKYTPLSVVVNVGKGPLVVNFKISDVTVTTGQSSTSSGSNEKYSSGVPTFEGVPTEVPFYSFLNIDVKDNITGKIVKQGGFSREYPSIEEQNLFVFETGEYRIDLYGSGLDVDLKIFSGTVQENPDAIVVDSASAFKFSELKPPTTVSTSDNILYEDEEEWWFQ